MASIVITNGQLGADRYPLGRRTTVVGRAEALPIQILDNLVSRKHLQIRFDPATGRYVAVDMRSKNGVFVNGARIRTETFLAHRDRIRIGNVVLSFTEQDGSVDETVLHRFKKAGEGLKPTHVDLQVRRSGLARAQGVAVARGRSGMLVTV